MWSQASNAQSLAYRTWEQEVAGLIPSLTNLFMSIDDSHCDRTLFCLNALTMDTGTWESSQWLERNIVQSTGDKELKEKHG